MHVGKSNVKDTLYNFRDSNIVFQIMFDKITYGKNTFKYYNTHLWNLVLNDIKKPTELTTFNKFIKKIERSDVLCVIS